MNCKFSSSTSFWSMQDQRTQPSHPDVHVRTVFQQHVICCFLLENGLCTARFLLLRATLSHTFTEAWKKPQLIQETWKANRQGPITHSGGSRSAVWHTLTNSSTFSSEEFPHGHPNRLWSALAGIATWRSARRDWRPLQCQAMWINVGALLVLQRKHDEETSSCFGRELPSSLWLHKAHENAASERQAFELAHTVAQSNLHPVGCRTWLPGGQTAWRLWSDTA